MESLQRLSQILNDSIETVYLALFEYEIIKFMSIGGYKSDAGVV